MHLSLDWLYTGFAWVMIHIHDLIGNVFDPDSGLAWGLSIVIMTILVRLVIFPLFVKQIRSQRAMAVLQPQLKELQKKYKDDKQKLQEEMMKLYRENGANPLSGCLPIIAQAPFLYAMYHVLNAISRDQAKYGLSAQLVDSAAHAKIFGVPIGLMFRDSAEKMAALGANPTLCRIVIIVFVVIMAVTTFIAQRQLMLKQTAQQQAAGQSTPFQQQQKIMLFIFPAMFLVWGFFFPMGLIVYWTTSNLWTMGQQFYVLHRHPHQPVQAKDGAKPATSTPAASGTSGKSAAAKSTPAKVATRNGSDSGGNGVAGQLFKRKRKAEAEPEPVPAARVVRNQPTRTPRKKRSGQKSGQGQKTARPAPKKTTGQKKS
ncbi:MAG TPA: membrane protein insertase YidC [Streptosporangiales bacterium]